jgi:hypothetical protein
MRRLSRFLPLLVLGTGCELAPDEPLFYTGQALREDASPWAGAPVELLRTGREATPPSAEPHFEPWATVTAGEDGRFVHELRVFDTQRLSDPTGSGAFGRDCRVQLPPGAGGERTWIRFYMYTSDARLPTLRAWHSGLSHAMEGTHARLSWEPVPPGDEDVPAPEYRAVLRSGQTVVWEEPASETRGTLPTDVGEDFPALAFSVEARSAAERSWFALSGGSGYVDYELVHEGPRVSLPATPGPLPVSRGAPCNLYVQDWDASAGPDGTPPLGPRIEPCPLTDGRLDAVAAGVQGVGATLLLPEPHVPRRALVRGLKVEALRWAGSAWVEGSADGETWHLLADFTERLPPESAYEDNWRLLMRAELYLDLALTPPSVPVRHVRLRFHDRQGAPLSPTPLARELSLFD